MKQNISPATTAIVVVIAVIMVGALGWIYLSRGSAPAPVPGGTAASSTNGGADSAMPSAIVPGTAQPATGGDAGASKMAAPQN